MKTKDDTTRVNANIKVGLHTVLKKKAASEGTTIGNLIEEWIAGLASQKHSSGNVRHSGNRQESTAA